MKIGIFGGGFNPIHNGHLRLAEWIVNAGYVDGVWLMVSPHNPLKNQAGLLPEDVRYELASLACANVEGVEACNYEFQLARPTYTWRTIEALREAYPQHEFALIIGGDNWLVFEKWAHYDTLLKTTEILVYPRDTTTEDAMPHLSARAKSVQVMQGAPLFPFSSTEVRERLRKGESVKDMIPQAVLERLNELNVKF